MLMLPLLPLFTVPVYKKPLPLPPADTALAVIKLMEPLLAVIPWPVVMATGPLTEAVLVVLPAIS